LVPCPLALLSDRCRSVELLTAYSNQTHVRESLEKLAALKPNRGPDQPRRPVQRQTRLRRAQVEDLVAGYRAGRTVYELAGSFGIDRRTVSAILKREGVRTRWRVMDEERTGRAVELYGSGLSLAEVARHVDTTSGTLRRALEREGVPRRPVGTNQWR
jgi:DNA invertase Pin-like site-specific DNA recombinase